MKRKFKYVGNSPFIKATVIIEAKDEIEASDLLEKELKEAGHFDKFSSSDFEEINPPKEVDFHSFEDNPYQERKFTEMDNKWSDVTDVNYSNRRKESFKVYANYFRTLMLHIFTGQERNGVQYYHVIDEHMTLDRPSEYAYMTMQEIEKKYELNKKVL